MCLRPLSIVTRSRLIKMQGGQPFVHSVPCGNCAECNTAKSNEYLLRSYYESQRCLDAGGFMLFCTLTYRDSNIPHLSDTFPIFKNTLADYTCFNRYDVRLFFVRLRTVLTRAGFDCAQGLKYFLSAEYGTSEKHTHRPHYHVIFYINFDIDPLVFARYISDCWPHGITDCPPFKDDAYVRTHIYKRDSDPVAVEKVCRYVSKYVVKSSTFEGVINSRIDIICQRLRDALHHMPDLQEWIESRYNLSPDMELQEMCDYFNTLAQGTQEFRDELKRRIGRVCNQFHRQSQGFGLAALDYNNIEDICNNGFITMPTSEKDVVKRVPLPMYFKRKLFYELTEDFRGSKVWKLNDLGHQFLLSRVKNNLDTLTNRFNDWYVNSSEIERSVIDEILNGRSFAEFSRYVAIYKGRVCHHSDFDESSPLDIWLFRQHYEDYSWMSKGYEQFMYNYSLKDDKFEFAEKCLINRYLGDCTHGWRVPDSYYYKDENGHIQQFTGYAKISVDSFVKFCVVNDTYSKSFAGFDTLYDIYVKSMYYRNIKKQSAYELKQKLQERQKAICNGVNPNYSPQTLVLK